MRSDDLTAAQAPALQEKLRPMLGYLNKLQRRMQKQGFPLEDPLGERVSQAQRPMQDLITELRCRAVQAKQGRPPSHSHPVP